MSFVIPCYRSELTIRSVTEEIMDTVAQRPGYDYEIICVNDCSPDNVYTVLKQLARENSRIKVIDFAINRGKHAAVLAGYRYCRGEYVVTLDDDMQSPTYELWKLVEPLEQDLCDAAVAKFKKKQQAAWKNLGSSINGLMSTILLNKPREMAFGNFSVYKRFVADEMAKYPNPFPYLEGLLLRTTRRILQVEMEERDRGDDKKTGYTLGKSIALFANGFTAFSVLPLRISTIVGLCAAVIGFILGLIMIIRRLVNPDVLIGYTSTVVIQLLMNGLILMSLGLLGEYVGRIYICINRSPQSVIRETINLEEYETAE